MLSFSLILMPLATKNYRIARIFNFAKGKLRVVSIKTSTLVKMVCLHLLLDTSILVIWYIMDPPVILITLITLSCISVYLCVDILVIIITLISLITSI